jgi:hypothetical protein
MHNRRTQAPKDQSFCGWPIAVLSAAISFLLAGCASFYLADCTEDGSGVLGEDVPRIRSSHLRMKLANTSSAAARFVPYAAMAALSYYVEDVDCGHEPKISVEERQALESIIHESRDPGQIWKRVRAVEKAGDCEDDLGLFYHVWEREIGDSVEIVVAFRGTWGMKDWYYGNLRWFTRFVTKEDQYIRARKYSHQVIDYFRAEAKQNGDNKTLKFYATGHSLGGGLAQNVLYDRPGDYIQAYTFDPSPVTGFTDQEIDTRIRGCSCEPSLGYEARIFRIYESYEILTHLRFWHKLFFKPHRHIHEIRFAFSASPNPVKQHSMVTLANSLATEARGKSNSQYGKRWYAGLGESCTALFEKWQEHSCSIKVTDLI